MKKYTVNLALGLLVAFTAFSQNNPMKGQDSLVLELERNEWLPESQKFTVDFPKINLTLPPKFPYSYTSDSFYHQPKMILPTLKVEGLQKPTLEKLYQGFAQFSFSTLLQPHLEFNINKGRTTQLDWGLKGEYQGLFSQYVPHSQRNFINISPHIGFIKENMSLTSQVNYQRFMFNYFGDSTFQPVSPTADSIKSHFSFIHWNNQFTYGNLQQGLYVQIPLNVISYSDRWKNQEFHFQSKPNLVYTFSKYSIGFQGNIHQVSLKNELQKHSRILIEANPYGLVNLSTFKLKLGMQWAKVDTLNYILPELEASYQMYPKSLDIFLGVKGEGSLNSLYEIKRLVPYIEPNFYQQSSVTPWKIYTGAKLQVKNLTVQVLGYYKKVNNLWIIFANFEDNLIQNRLVKQGYLTSLYDRVSSVYGWNFVFDWNNHKNIQVSFEANYQNWKLQNYEFNFHQPHFKLKIEGRYTINKKIELFSKISYISPITLGYLLDHSFINQKGIFLADTRIGYNFQSNIQFFLGGNNLFNQKYFLFRDYQELPIHGYTGFRIIF